jgi:TolA-binding protein
MAKTTIEKIETLQAQIQQLENQRKQLVQTQKEAERKARTKRLIERGAILESLIPNAADYTNKQIQALLVKIIVPDNARKILDGLAGHDGETAVAQPAWTKRAALSATTDKSGETARGTE